MANIDADVVVIGSGAGGLAAAVGLAQSGKKVIVFEQHYVPGGWCHSFTREGYKFSPGVHYIGGLGPGGTMRAIYEGLGVAKDLTFCEINPDGYDHIIIGNERFDMPKGKQQLGNRLKSRFPQESEGIDGYLNFVQNVMTELSTVSAHAKGLGILGLPRRAPNLFKWGWRSAESVLDHFVSDPLLKAILSAQAGDHGMPLSKTFSPVHAAITHHYFDGGFYPMGGAFAIPRAFVRALKEAGGELHLGANVSQILMEGKQAVGVRLADGSEIRATHVVSNADPEVTFGRLVGRDHLSRKLRRRLNRTRYSGSALSLFMAVDFDLREAGMDSGNYWYYRHEDIDKIYRQGMTDHVLAADKPPAMFLTATTLKDPTKMHSGHHTLEAFSFVNYEPFARWASEEEGKRSPDYEALKQKLTDRMVLMADEIIPGLKDHLVFCELGTPVTNELYLNSTKGNLYGIAKDRFQVGPFAYPLKTEFEGLWMCGASTLAHGVSGATASGLAVAAKILGCRTKDLLTASGPELQVYPSEDPSQWPARLRRRIKQREISQEEADPEHESDLASAQLPL